MTEPPVCAGGAVTTGAGYGLFCAANHFLKAGLFIEEAGS